MKWGVLVLLVAVAGARASHLLTFPEVGREISQSRQGRIVSGWEATEGQIPHQLSLRMVSVAGQVFGCGASIIHNLWALTAAHCTANRPTIVIRVGATELVRPSILFESTEYYNHPDYNEAIAGIVQPHDIGVIKFPIWIDFTPTVQPVRVQSSADRSVNYEGERLTASGWGALWSQGASPQILNWVYLIGVSNAQCRSAFGGSSIIVDSTICARYYNVTSQSTCQGDSGGPLTIIDKDGQPTVVGVTSFVSAMGCHVGMPAGFCRPGYYHDWFTEVTGVNFDWDWSTTTTTAAPEEDSNEDSSENSSSEESSEDGSNSSESDEGSGLLLVV